MKKKTYHTIRIKDITIEYHVEYRNVKYTRYEIKNGQLKLVTQKQNKDNIKEQIHKKDNWIYNKIKQQRQFQEKNRKLTQNKRPEQRTLKQLKQHVNNKIEQYEKQLNVKAKRIQYRQMTRKWGSCSSLGNITLSRDLKYLPDKLVSYIVYHELAHLIIMAHNKEFYQIIEREYPDYKKLDEELEQYHYMINNTIEQN
ncbi:MAG: hypothetical protein BZ138_04530 [Methanosphaera sp. rholeuAM270]|nr:MAG: hypothetical protein BZ138_04530 [Methanosphaera sp. rholeuAM270]